MADSPPLRPLQYKYICTLHQRGGIPYEFIQTICIQLFGITNMYMYLSYERI
jgi:hypothetical protein